MMMLLLSLVLTGALAAQTGADPYAEAERLARAGNRQAALKQFRDWAAAHPDDMEARLWIGRLHADMGHPELAEPVFRGVLASNPGHVPAKVGLGSVLLDQDRPDEALVVLEQAERLAPNDATVLAALARAHATLGHTARALARSRRAAALAPTSGGIRHAYEELREAEGHRLEIAGFGEHFSRAVRNPGQGDAALSLRLNDRWRLGARGQYQNKFDRHEARGGLTGEWRMTRSLTWRSQVLAGGATRVLPRLDGLVEGAYSYDRYETSGLVRYIQFSDARITLVSPGLTVSVRDGWLLTGRYSLGLTDYRYSSTVQSSHSGSLGTRYRLLPRVWGELGYARGIENLDTLSIDRVGRFRDDTASGGFRVDLPSLTSVTGRYDYQWRNGDRRMQRATLTIVQRF